MIDATEEDVAAAVEAATPVVDQAGLLRAIAEAIEGLGDELLELADRETALGLPRLTNERARTTGQLRMFADLVDEGSYVEAIIDHGPPDVRRMQIPIGPVAVFGAGNFPLAFGVAGGDTASALAAGCPVIAKAHPGHPGTSQMVADAIASVAPPGAFALLHGAGHHVGAALVRHPAIKAVGFTGSLAGGRALYDLAAARPEPIPVYAEMGSVNPLFVTEAALQARTPEIAEGFVGSFTMGTGQFCTKPGIVVVPTGPAGDAFVDAVAPLVRDSALGCMLDARLKDNLLGRLEQTLKLDGVAEVARGSGDTEAVVLATTAETFLASPDLAEEHFGPVCIVVRADDPVAIANAVPGSLTASIHAEPGDDIAALVAALQQRVGRLVFNGYPTGVAVVPAQHHGGPYPATTAPAHTSVGTTAIRRFLRPVAWQDAPPALLPPELQEENPKGILRLVDNAWTR